METKLVVPIAAGDLKQAREQIKAATAAGAEMLELRTDYLENLCVNLVKSLIAEVKKAVGRELAIIVTCRDKRQGGARKYPQKLRIEVLSSAADAGAEFIDFEYENFLSVENQEKIELALSQSSKARLILSAHNFEGKFDNIGKLYRHILTLYPAAIPKLVYTANHIEDCFEAFDLLHQTSGERIVFCMGKAGLISRIIAKKLNCFVTYGCVDEKSATAPGQLTVKQLKKLYRWASINEETELYGVIGSPVAHSLSPVVHNACFVKMRANKLYLPLLVEGGKGEFDRFMKSVLNRKWLGFRGFSVTIPHKQNALNYVRENAGFVEPIAEKIGAANTVLVGPDGKLGAYNTDYTGALDAIISAMGISKGDLKEVPVTVIGAGGAARAIVAGLSDAGAKITIYNRTVEKAERLAKKFNCDFAPLNDLPKLSAKLIINSTSIGMYPDMDATPLPQKCIRKDMVVFDTVYNPAETFLLKQAKEAGAKTVGGLEMFVNQALAQFKLFSGQTANGKLMRKTIRNCLSKP